ncbi:MAG TPA: hypothetical protein VG164_05820 [Trebonia sp.]|nr:hypothetical protein [Trebonia sp.]
MITPDEAHAHAIGGMLAAIEYARILHARTEGHISTPATGDGLAAVAADCAEATPPLDLTGALAAITLRAATLACQASTVAGQPLTVLEFLDELVADFTAPDDLSGLS